MDKKRKGRIIRCKHQKKGPKYGTRRRRYGTALRRLRATWANLCQGRMKMLDSIVRPEEMVVRSQLSGWPEGRRVKTIQLLIESGVRDLCRRRLRATMLYHEYRLNAERDWQLHKRQALGG